MRLVCLLMVALLLSQSAYALTLPPDIAPASSTFNSKTKIRSAANSAKNNCTSPSDYIFKGTIFALEVYLPSLLGSRLLAKNAAGAFLGTGLKRAGLSSSGVSISKKLILPSLKSLQFLNPDTFLKKNLANFFAGMVRRRPTPGGLRLGARTAIAMASESYYYVTSRAQESPHTISAEQHLQAAVSEYNSYTGLLDSFTLTYSSYSPEGYNKILSECLLAIDDLSQAKKQMRESEIRVS